MDLLKTQHWTFPVPITYGPGCLQTLAEACRANGITSPLLVTDEGSRDLPFVSQAIACLRDGKLAWDVFSDVSPNPRDTQIQAGRTQFREGQHDGVIAIGGGSGMDAGKAICLVANNDVSLLDFDFEKTSPEPAGAFPPLICIPSTAGTGAETESTAMITDTQRGIKVCIWHSRLKPGLAMLDPSITVALPANLTAWTGCDALVHAIEAYCVPAFHPLCDGVALEGMRLIGANLERAFLDPDDLSARGGMLVGSCLAGVAFMKGLGLVHAISHMVGAEFDTHHGLTNAIVLPTVLQFNADTISDKVPNMAAALGCRTHAMDAFYGHICALLDRLRIPERLADIAVPASGVQSIAAKAMLDPARVTNPRPVSLDQMTGLVEQALLQGR